MARSPGSADVRDLVDDVLPFNQHLGVEVVAFVEGRATVRLRADDRIANHVGGVHAIAELAPASDAGDGTSA